MWPIEHVIALPRCQCDQKCMSEPSLSYTPTVPNANALGYYLLRYPHKINTFHGDRPSSQEWKIFLNRFSPKGKYFVSVFRRTDSKKIFIIKYRFVAFFYIYIKIFVLTVVPVVKRSKMLSDRFRINGADKSDARIMPY